MADLAELVLTPPANIYKQVQKILESAFRNGQTQVIDDIRKQGMEIAADIQAIVDSERVQAITDATVARVVNEVQTRAINQVSTLQVLGEVVTGAVVILALEDQSTAWLDSYANGAVNAATQVGRAEEMESHGDQIKRYEYSAILDAALCWFCKQWDGEQSDFLEGLPSVPNATCEGRDRCRCRIIAVVET